MILTICACPNLSPAAFFPPCSLVGFVYLFRFVSFSFRPVLPVSYVQSELAFEAADECQLFLAALSLVYTGTDTTKIDCRQSLAVLANF
uniref:Uncharacterized protein n=1 Tax=Chrysemys picta bellii TaxID=8478 RepID=A0A8C3HTX9_CHRPI